LVPCHSLQGTSVCCGLVLLRRAPIFLHYGGAGEGADSENVCSKKKN